MKEISLSESALRSASKGATLAEQIIHLLDAGESVRIDFSTIQIMTPSFTNTFMMRLLDRYDIPYLRSKCEFANRSPHVIAAMNRAVQRFQSGIRLSSQLTSA